MALAGKLMGVLVCTKCRRSLERSGMFLSCAKCGLAYPVLEGGVPDMLIGDAWKLEKAGKAGFRHTLRA